jgi:Bacterial Ig-like domain (group 3)
VQPTTTTVGAKSVQYSDKVTLTATVAPAGCSGSVAFAVNGVATSTASYTQATGIATVDYTDALAAGSYTIDAAYTSDGLTFCSSSAGSNTLTVIKEDTKFIPDSGNPDGIQVSTAGGNYTGAPFPMKMAVSENTSTLAPHHVLGTIDGPGDGSLITVSNTCAVTAIYNSYSATFPVSYAGGAATCTITPPAGGFPVDTYDVAFSVPGANNYYQDSGDTSFTIFDPSLGFTTGGGKIQRDLSIVVPTLQLPSGSTYMVNFGFVNKYLKNGQNKGSLLYIEHRITGDLKLKSNAMGALSINSNVATFDGKATLNGVGGYRWQVTVVDNGQGANSPPDTIALSVWDPNNIPVPDLTFGAQPLAGGNIQVPQPGGKK